MQLAIPKIEGITPARIEHVEAELLCHPQLDTPCINRFGAGVYIREVHLPAGALIVGHHHKSEHQNILLKGRLTLLKSDGTLVERSAPWIGKGSPGRKVAIIQEDVIWLNIYPTTETDVAKIEEQLFEKSDAWFANEMTRIGMDSLVKQPDRDDFKLAIAELGLTAEVVQQISENEADQIPMPEGCDKVMIASSPIHGRGVFVTAEVAAGEVIGPARINNQRTPIGRYANHSAQPSAEMVMMDGNVFLVALRRLRGCQGGSPGDEATVCYRKVRAVTERKQLCQQ